MVKYFKVTIKTESKVKSTDIKFKLGEPFQVKFVCFCQDFFIFYLPRMALCLKILSSHQGKVLEMPVQLNTQKVFMTQEETADGRTVTTTAKLDGDTLTKTQVFSFGVDLTSEDENHSENEDFPEDDDEDENGDEDLKVGERD